MFFLYFSATFQNFKNSYFFWQNIFPRIYSWTLEFSSFFIVKSPVTFSASIQTIFTMKKKVYIPSTLKIWYKGIKKNVMVALNLMLKYLRSWIRIKWNVKRSTKGGDEEKYKIPGTKKTYRYIYAKWNHARNDFLYINIYIYT